MNPGEVGMGRVRRSCAKYTIRTSACSNKKKKSGIIASLPEEIIFNILVCVPADILYNLMRYVCRKWYNIISDPVFIEEHLLRARACVLIHENEPPLTAHFLEMGRRRFVVREVSYQFPMIVLASCDGLVVFGDPKTFSLHVENPITKHKVNLPPFPWSTDASRFAMARACPSGEYKIVSTNDYPGTNIFRCMLLGIGKDYEWKEIGNNLSDPARKIFLDSSFSAGGFVYWASFSFPYCVAFDVESEQFSEFPTPVEKTDGDEILYVEMGNTLSCFVRKHCSLIVDVWVLSDPRSGNWIKLYQIDMEGKKRMFCRKYEDFYSGYTFYAMLVPLAWMNNGEVVLFCFLGHAGPFIAHNVKTRETRTFGFHERHDWSYFCHEYVNSLVSI